MLGQKENECRRLEVALEKEKDRRKRLRSAFDDLCAFVEKDNKIVVKLAKAAAEGGE